LEDSDPATPRGTSKSRGHRWSKREIICSTVATTKPRAGCPEVDHKPDAREETRRRAAQTPSPPAPTLGASTLRNPREHSVWAGQHDVWFRPAQWNRRRRARWLIAASTLETVTAKHVVLSLQALCAIPTRTLIPPSTLGTGAA